MSAINSAMTSIFGLIWAPFEGMNPWIGLTLLGVVFGILALLAMKYCSNQARIVELKDRYKGHVLAIKLFRDDLGVVISSLLHTLRLIGFYLGHQLRPMAVMMIPFVLIFAQMQMRLAYSPLPVGTETMVSVELSAQRPGEDVEVVAELPVGVELAGKPVRIPARKMVVYRLKVTAPGRHELRFQAGAETVTKSLHVGLADDGTPMVSPVRSASFMDLLLFPTEPTFEANSGFSKIALSYPVRPLPFLGIDWSFGMELGMGITFVIISLVAAFLLKGAFGVTI